MRATPRSTLDFLPDPLWLVDAGELVTYANAAAKTFAHAATDDPVGRRVWDLVPCPPDSDLPLGVARALRGDVVDGEATLPDHGAHVTFRVFPHEGGAALLVRDVTRERRDARQLRASEALYRTLFEASPRIVMMLAPNATVLRANQRWQSYTGVPLDPGADWTAFVYEEDRAALQARLRTHVPERTPLVTEVRVPSTSGEARWHLLHLHPVRHDGHDGPVGWILSMNDVHEQKLAEARSATLLSELEARVASRTAELDTHARALEAFATFTEVAGGELDEGVLARRAIDVLQDTLGANVDLCYYVRGARASAWRAVALSRGFTEAGAAKLREGLALEETALARVASTRAPTFFTNAAPRAPEPASPGLGADAASEYRTVAFYHR